MGAYIAAILTVSAASALIIGRVSSLPVAAPSPGGTGVWLLVGLDDREGADRFADAGYLDDPGGTGVGRADVLVVVRSGSNPSAMTVSRDLVLATHAHPPDRLATAFGASPQTVVDLLCGGLGIAIDHVATLDMAGLGTLVDDLGGVLVDQDVPIRDRYTGLELQAGVSRLDGAAALALVRSRRAEVWRKDQWIADERGDAGRTARAGLLLGALTHRALSSPTQLGRTTVAAWHLSGRLGLSTATSPTDLIDLAQALRAVGDDLADLPVDRRDGALPLATPNVATTAVVDRFSTEEERRACAGRALPRAPLHTTTPVPDAATAN